MWEKIKEYLSKYIQKRRQYRACSLYNKTLAKVFNRGMGCVDIVRFYPDVRKICVAENLVSNIDLKNLAEIQKDLDIEDWEVVCVNYNPWGNNCLGLHLYQNPIAV